MPFENWFDRRIEPYDERLAALKRGGDGSAPITLERVNVAHEPTIDHESDLAAELLEYLDDREEIAHTFVLPEGTYRWDTCFDIAGFEFLAIFGGPLARLDVSEQIGTVFDVGHPSGRSKCFGIGNLFVDITGTDADGTAIDVGLMRTFIDYQLEAENLQLFGRRDRAQDVDGDGEPDKVGDKFSVYVNILDETGVGHVRKLRMTDGETERTDSQFDHSIAIGADPSHQGTTIWENCYLEGFVSNAFYLANSPGQNIVRGCTLKNNGGSNIRLGAGDVARDSRIIIDNGRDQRTPGCGLWLNGGRALAENITIDAPELANDAIRVNSGTDGGTIRDCDVFVGADSTGARALRVTGGGKTSIENVTIDDESSGDFSVYARREDVTFRGLEVTAPNRNAVFCDVRDVRFHDCRFEPRSGGAALTIARGDVDVIGCRVDCRDGDPARVVVGSDVDAGSINASAVRFRNARIDGDETPFRSGGGDGGNW